MQIKTHHTRADSPNTHVHEESGLQNHKDGRKGVIAITSDARCSASTRPNMPPNGSIKVEKKTPHVRTSKQLTHVHVCKSTQRVGQDVLLVAVLVTGREPNHVLHNTQNNGDRVCGIAGKLGALLNCTCTQANKQAKRKERMKTNKKIQAE